jgi:ribosomal protection tetracycline resistance protein
VQKEVLQQTLANDYGVDIEFRETVTICREIPRGTGQAVDRIGEGDNPFLATIGIRISPGPVGSGIAFKVEADFGMLPIYLFKTMESFTESMMQYVRAPLEQGLDGWQVIDCVVTLTECGYSAPGTKAGDYRKLVPLVVMEALRQAGTVVCEPVHEFRIEGPAESRSSVTRLLSQLRATTRNLELVGPQFLIEGSVPAAEVHRLQSKIVGTTHGEGVIEAHFDSYAPTVGVAPTRPRFDDNPLNRKDYLRHVVGGI